MENIQTILVVDDTQSNIDILLELLGSYDVVVALNGEEALQILKQEQNISLILMDIMMPNIDGFEVCKQIKNDPLYENYKDTPLIFITAKNDDESIQYGFELGAVDYVVKPFRPIELLSRVKTHLKLSCFLKDEIDKNKFIALGELVQNIAHQWRQPLSSISTASSGMLMQKEMGMLNDDDFVRLCSNITEQTQYLSNTIENLQFLLNPNIEKAKFNISELMHKRFEMIYEHKNRLIDFDFDIEENLYIVGAQSLLYQIVEHLIINSTEALGDKETKIIQIKLFSQNEYVVLSITDSGGGVPLEIIDKIFEPYFTTKHKSLGTGLGLYSVKGYVNKIFQGSINITNKEFICKQNTYFGASFEIFIPRA